MKLTWFGTAGFKIESGEHTLLIDPYFTRNSKAFPRQPLKASDIQTADQILITHGHFDHILDVPEIAENTNAMVYCGRGVDQTLIQNGLNPDHIHRVRTDGEAFRLDGLKVQAFFQPAHPVRPLVDAQDPLPDTYRPSPVSSVVTQLPGRAGAQLANQPRGKSPASLRHRILLSRYR